MTNTINKFSKKVDLRNREEMVKFLTSHFRYDTMNSWNNATSYAHNVKLYNLGLTEEQLDKAYEMLESNELYYLAFEPCIAMWNKQHNYEWQVGFNGRSDGYLVLYTGGQKDSGFKSQCTECGQLNYKTVEETGCTCGKCGKIEEQYNNYIEMLENFKTVEELMDWLVCDYEFIGNKSEAIKYVLTEWNLPDDECDPLDSEWVNRIGDTYIIIAEY